ncbi:MAG: penicillin-binding protein 1C, partial [Alphaproteobacteria bacterium]
RRRRRGADLRCGRPRWRPGLRGALAGRLRIAIFAAVAVALATAGGGAWLDRAHPPDLSALRELSTAIEDRDGRLLRLFANRDGRWRLPATVDDVPPYFLAALTSFEDRRFARHWGVDPLAIGRAAAQNVAAGRVVSGASTITQQVVRLLEPRPRSWSAKLVEAARAVQLELHHSKDEILGMYLTLAPYGGPVEGVRAAALVYFGKPAHALTPAEAALLVALPQSPTRLRPDRWPDRARAARDKVLARAAGTFGPGVAAEALAEPLRLTGQGLPMLAPRLAGRLAREHPGRTVRTTLDGTLQAAVEALARREVGPLGSDVSAAVLVVDNRDGDMRAHVGGLDLLDARRAGFVDLATAARSPGSVLKPFVYGMAFDARIVHPRTVVADVPTRFGAYEPGNFDHSHRGDLTVAEALQRSLNIPAVAILSEVGALRFADALGRSGATLRLPPGADRAHLPVVLGGASVSLREVTTLYAGLARGGSVRPIRIRADEPPGSAFRLLSPAAAAQIAEILRGTALPAGAPHLAGGRATAIAFKTGTSYGFRDSWAVGFTADHTVGVWVGRPDGTPMPGTYGLETAAPILMRVFDLLPVSAPATPQATMLAGAPPPALVRFSVGDAVRAPGAVDRPDRLQVLSPANGSTVVLAAGGAREVALRAAGGTRPLRWLVDGRPLDSAPHRRDALWRPEGPGFHRIVVVDAEGRSAALNLRVRRPDSHPAATGRIERRP